MSFKLLESIVNKKRKAVDDLAVQNVYILFLNNSIILTSQFQGGSKFIRMGDLPQIEREKFDKKQQGLRDKDQEVSFCILI